MAYGVFLESRADKELGKLPQDVQDRIDEAIDALAEDPRPPAARKLSGLEGYRLRGATTASSTWSTMLKRPLP